jgi:hypothetical protein
MITSNIMGNRIKYLLKFSAFKQVFRRLRWVSLIALVSCNSAFAQDENEGPPGWKFISEKNGARGWESPSRDSMLIQIIRPERSDYVLDTLIVSDAKIIRTVCPSFAGSVIVQQVGVNERKVQCTDSKPQCSVSIKRGNGLVVTLVAIDYTNGDLAAQSIVASRLNALTVAPIQVAKAPPFIAAFFETRTNSNGGTQVVSSVGAEGIMVTSIIPSWTISAQDNIQILFADGSACWNCLDDYYVDSRLTKLRREKPDELGKWRKLGNQYLVTYPDLKGEPPRFPFADSLQLANLGQLFKLKLSTNTGVSTGSLVLRRDGTFSIAAKAELDVAGSKNLDSKLDDYGTYEVTGPTIRFRFANETLKQCSLLVDPKKLKDYVLIVVFTIKKMQSKACDYG